MIEEAWDDVDVDTEYDMARVAAISLCKKARDKRLVIASVAHEIIISKGHKLSLSRVRRLAQIGIIYSRYIPKKTKHRYGYCTRPVLHVDPKELEWYCNVGLDKNLNQIEKKAKRDKGWHPEIFRDTDEYLYEGYGKLEAIGI